LFERTRADGAIDHDTGPKAGFESGVELVAR
jgi:hypothetical protein